MEVITALLDEALAARDAAGPTAAASRLLVFTRVVNALELFVKQEARRRAATTKVRALSTRLSEQLRAIEKESPVPSIESVRAYYQTAGQLRVALTELAVHTRDIA